MVAGGLATTHPGTAGDPAAAIVTVAVTAGGAGSVLGADAVGAVDGGPDDTFAARRDGTDADADDDDDEAERPSVDGVAGAFSFADFLDRVGLVPAAEVCAPPELDTTTPGATSVTVADGDDVGAAGVPDPASGGDPAAVCGASPGSGVFGGAAAGSTSAWVSVPAPPAGAPAPPAEASAGALADASDGVSGVAHAAAGDAAIAVPIPSATANAPTRPI
jgi:hypothetical protein